MKESFWGIFVISLGVTAIGLVYFFQTFTTTNEHNYHLLKETTESAMVDAFDLAAYKRDGTIRIDREKFVENFLRRFAENASLSKTYKIKIYDIVEEPPKVSIEVASAVSGSDTTGTVYEFDIVDRINSILEEPY